MIVADLDPEARAHLARALAGHRRWCQVNGYAWPPDLERLALAVRSGLERTNSDVGDEVDHDPIVPLAYTFAHAGELLDGLSEKTIKRLADRGELPVVEIGRSRRIARADLEAFLDRQRREGRPRDER